MSVKEIDGPFFEDLHVGDLFDQSPSMTLTAGLAAAHQSIVGNRLSVTVDHRLSESVIGPGPALVSPALAWDISIGQSTLATHAVVANLYYRNLAFHRAPRLGDTLTSTTTVVGLRRNRPRPGRRPTGLALLNIHTVDQEGRTVLDYQRCAMVAARGSGSAEESEVWPLDTPQSDPSTSHFDDWDLAAVRKRYGRSSVEAGDEFHVAGGDVVSSAPELVRLTQNIAKVHHDATVGGGRLVYGGHSVGLALHHLVRALPALITVTSWKSCDHTGPVHEGDTLLSRVLVEEVKDAGDRTYATVRVLVRAVNDAGNEIDVLDWVLTALLP
jgi:acyl dehydratase